MLAIFFVFVLVCAFFFAIGFSLGRKTAVAGSPGSMGQIAATPATVVRPSPAKGDATKSAAPAEEMSFYKAVGAKNADAALPPQDSKAPPVTATPTSSDTAAGAQAATGAVPSMPTPATSLSGGYNVQVAAVSRQEDADALVEALKKKQYPAFIASNPASDRFYHVQVGPYADVKDAEAMRARLISDGYNPIVKR
jgi:cell division protein FtsN